MPLTAQLTKYTTSAGPLINVSYTDWLTNTGIIEFYGYASTISTGTSYHLSTKPFYSEPIGIEYTSTSGTAYGAPQQDIDFDTGPFAKSLRIGGTATINLTFIGRATTPDQHIKHVITIRKWDGTTETDLVSVTSEDYTDIDNPKVACLEAEVPTTIIEVGQTLRVTWQAYSYNDPSAGTIRYSCVFDPMNRDYTSTSGTTNITASSTAPTNFIINMPFEVEE